MDQKEPSYEALRRLCAELQDKVAQGITIQQQLNTMRAELDRELNRFKAIQQFSQEGMFQRDVQHFGQLATEYFVKTFEQPHCLIAEFDASGDLSVIGQFGFHGQALPKVLPLPLQELPFEGSLLRFVPAQLQQHLSLLNMVDAMIALMFSPDRICCGLVICGQQLKDQRFYDPISPKDLHAFNVMVTKTSYLLHDYRVNERLRKEISERRRVEKMLEAKAEDLLRTNAELEQFAYVVSHDLKAPLRNISGFTRQLQRRHAAELSAGAQAKLDTISQEMSRFGRIVDALLQYARITSLAGQEASGVDLNELLEELNTRLHLALHERNAQITTTPLPTLHVNRQQMEQLFQNLVTNAIKFAQPDQNLQLHISSRPIAENGHHFVVQDNGIGLEQEEEGYIFRLFKRGANAQSTEGSGLGLSICKKIVEQYNGRIWAESTGQNQGTTINFTLYS